MNDIRHTDGGAFGPFYAILNRDGTLRCNEANDPYVFSAIGPHDNHTKHGRKVIRVMVEVLADESCVEKHWKTSMKDIKAEVAKTTCEVIKTYLVAALLLLAGCTEPKSHACPADEFGGRPTIATCTCNPDGSTRNCS